MLVAWTATGIIAALTSTKPGFRCAVAIAGGTGASQLSGRAMAARLAPKGMKIAAAGQLLRRFTEYLWSPKEPDELGSPTGWQ